LVQNDTKNRVIEVLKMHPEGLIAIELSKILGSHRHTVSKYIYQLVDEGLINQRDVGTAKLCYLRNDNVRKQY